MRDGREETWTSPWPAPTLPEPPKEPDKRGAKRPAWLLVAGLAVAARIGRDQAGRFAGSRYGLLGFVAVLALAAAFVLTWRLVQRARIRARGDVEHTPEMVVRQLGRSGLQPPAFPEDGTLLGASILLVNQRAKVLEVETEYEVFGSTGTRLGTIRQVGQTRAKQFARVLTAFDQYFTHQFDACDLDGRLVLRLVRPAKLFRSKVHVYDGALRPLGTISQRNVFGKIRFEVLDAGGNLVGHLRASNLKAWDFVVLDRFERQLAEVVKSWEGWGKTAFTRADSYVVRVGEPLPSPMRELTLATALAIDVAIKQDARGFG